MELGGEWSRNAKLQITGSHCWGLSSYSKAPTNQAKNKNGVTHTTSPRQHWAVYLTFPESRGRDSPFSSQTGQSNWCLIARPSSSSLYREATWSILPITNQFFFNGCIFLFSKENNLPMINPLQTLVFCFVFRPSLSAKLFFWVHTNILKSCLILEPKIKLKEDFEWYCHFILWG